MLGLIKRTLDKLPVDYGEVRIEKKLVLLLVLSNSKIENTSKKEVLCGNIRILNKGQWGFISFSDIARLEKYVRMAMKNSKEISRYSSKKRQVKNSGKVRGHFQTSFRIDPFSRPLEEKHQLLLDYDRTLLGFKKLINRKFHYLERKEEIFYGNTEGSLLSQDKTFTGVSGQAIARDGDNIQIGRDSWGGYQGYEMVTGHDRKIEEIGRTAEGLLGARMLEAGPYQVIMDQKLSGVFAHEAFGHLSESDFLFENKDLLKIMPLGKQFGIDELNIIDQGDIPGEAGQIFVDDEGVLPQKTYLIKNGVLNSRLHSRETAFQMKEELTGNARAEDASFQPIVRMTNTYIDKGRYSREQMFESMEDGIYAVDYIGGQTNLEMFTFTAGRAYRVRNGKIMEMYKNVSLSGNVFETLFDIEMIGNEVKLFGGMGGCGKGGQSVPVSTGGPLVKIKKVLIGGV